MIKILIVGRTSFIALNLRKFLSKFFKVDIATFENVVKKKNSFFFKIFPYYKHLNS